VIESVSDEEILEAYKFIASKEGIFCEPASAATLAGVIKMSKQNYFSDGDMVVCTLTGHGLKDPDIALKMSEQPVKVKADISAIEEILKGCCL
jgi:threonine synthase